MIGRADFANVLVDLVHGELLRSQIIGLSFGFGITEFRRIIVPHAARRFLAVVFAFNHRQARNFVAAFGADADVHELAGGFIGAAMRVGPAAMRIIFVLDSAQLRRVFARDFLVAAFPDQDGGIVAEINNRVAEGGGANFPRSADGVGFAVHARLVGNQSEFVAGLDHVRPASAMSPADEIAACVFHQLQRIKLQPIRLRRAETGPFLGWALAPAVEFQMMAVDPKAGFHIPMNGADAERNFGRVHGFIAQTHRTNDVVKIRIIRLPKLRVRDGEGKFCGGLRARRDFHGLAHRRHGFAVVIQDFRPHNDLFACAASIFHGNFSRDVGGLIRNVRCINVRPDGLQKIIERQRNVKRVGHVKPDVAINPAHAPDAIADCSTGFGWPEARLRLRE